MGKRREGRMLVVQFFYQQEHSPSKPLDDGLLVFWLMVDCTAEARKFAEPLIRGMAPRLKELDAHLNRIAQNWDTKRMAPVDRNILRLALYEMHHVPEVPPVVAINEAIELAKELSTDDSGKFVNGILDRARKELPRPAPTAGPGNRPSKKKPA
ncbi:MAG: transcription antitermination factor NusB [Candidatus Methylacidiphilales bacterium]|nr:transcription antitermination factor NusB [Candidatus Methylacidiphilales bacterium]